MPNNYENIEDALISGLDEVVDSITENIKMASYEGAEFAVDDSPVDTGRFKGNWYVSVGFDSSFRDENRYDAGGGSTMSLARSALDKYDASEADFIYIYNNVSDGEEDYASTVTYDYTESKATDIMDQMQDLTFSLIK